MPNALIKTYAKESGKSVKEVEKIWEQAKEQADKKFEKKDSHYWSYVNLTVRRKLGLDQKQRAKEKEEKKKAKVAAKKKS